MTFSDLDMTGLERLGTSIMVAGLLSAAIAFAAPIAARASLAAISPDVVEVYRPGQFCPQDASKWECWL